MEFITAEQFLKEDKKVQEVFIDWWKPERGDLVAYEHTIIGTGKIRKEMCMNCLFFHSNVKYAEKVGKYIPLLTEGQLRKFIESKTGAKYIELEHYLKTGYDIYIENMLFEDLGNDLLQAYWKVAVQIAKESLK